jgi:hypothetical protein
MAPRAGALVLIRDSEKNESEDELCEKRKPRLAPGFFEGALPFFSVDQLEPVDV